MQYFQVPFKKYFISNNIKAGEMNTCYAMIIYIFREEIYEYIESGTY